MAQDRMLRQSMRTSEKVNAWPIPLRYFWTQLWGYCDDWGRGRYDARLIVADTYPIDDEVTAATVSRWMTALEMAGVVRPYEVSGKRYFECINWLEHQEISYLKRTDIPDSSGVVPKAGKHSEKFQKIPEQSGPSKGEGEGEVKRREGQNTPPPRFCLKHPTGTDTRCIPCRDARLLRADWDEAKKNRPSTRPPTSKEIAATMCRHHVDYPLPCSLCKEIALKEFADAVH